jgi:hypothetical protein
VGFFIINGERWESCHAIFEESQMGVPGSWTLKRMKNLAKVLPGKKIEKYPPLLTMSMNRNGKSRLKSHVSLPRIMKPPLHFCIVALMLAVVHFTSIPRVHADDLDKSATEDLLTSKPWKLTMDKGWSIVRTFNKGGTFMTPNRPDESGHWKISGNTIIQTFADGRKDILTLPLNVEGTSGIAKDGETMTAVQEKSVSKISAPDPFSIPVTGTGENATGATITLLTSGPWRIVSEVSGWSRVRIFERGGTFATQSHADEHGTWKVSNQVVTLTFADGHKDILLPPLDPKNTAGADSVGAPMTATLVTPNSGDKTPARVPPPQPEMDEQGRATTVALLISGPWKLSTAGWADVRVFMKDGTFMTVHRTDENGHWEISGNAIILTFPNGHKDSITLPLNPKGTTGVADGGDTMTAVRENVPIGTSLQN